jgi:hypothetical protein
MGKRHSDITFSSMKGYDNIFPSWEFYLSKTCFIEFALLLDFAIVGNFLVK